MCVFLPRSLLPFRKNLDSKRTIYFEWPNEMKHVGQLTIGKDNQYTTGPPGFFIFMDLYRFKSDILITF